MEIILLERVEKLGQIGDVVTVKDGYARNFLLPNKKALRSNNANRKVFEANKARIVAENDTRRDVAQAASKDVDGKSVTLIRQASNTGQLYGSVAVRDIIEALEAEQKLLHEQLAGPGLYTQSAVRASELHTRNETIDAELMAALERWEVLGSR